MSHHIIYYEPNVITNEYTFQFKNTETGSIRATINGQLIYNTEIPKIESKWNETEPTVWISIWQFFFLSITSIWKYFTFSFLYGLHLHTHHNLTSLYFICWRSHSGIHFRFGINHFIDHKIYNRIFNIHLAINALIIEIITKCSLSLSLFAIHPVTTTWMPSSVSLLVFVHFSHYILWTWWMYRVHVWQSHALQFKQTFQLNNWWSATTGNRTRDQTNLCSSRRSRVQKWRERNAPRTLVPVEGSANMKKSRVNSALFIDLCDQVTTMMTTCRCFSRSSTVHRY